MRQAVTRPALVRRMGFRFRRSVKLFPGVRVNLSKSGASVSVGPRGAHYTVGPKGTRVTAGIPGTGLSWSNHTVTNPNVQESNSLTLTELTGRVEETSRTQLSYSWGP